MHAAKCSYAGAYHYANILTICIYESYISKNLYLFIGSRVYHSESYSQQNGTDSGSSKSNPCRPMLYILPRQESQEGNAMVDTPRFQT